MGFRRGDGVPVKIVVGGECKRFWSRMQTCLWETGKHKGAQDYADWIHLGPAQSELFAQSLDFEASASALEWA